MYFHLLLLLITNTQNRSRGLYEVLYDSMLVIAFIYLVAPKGAVLFI